MTPYYRFGQDKNFPAVTINANLAQEIATPGAGASSAAVVLVEGDHKVVIRAIGAASAVLLKNVNKELPFTGQASSYGLFGSDAFSNPNGINSCALQSCSDGQYFHLAQGGGSGSSNYRKLSPACASSDYR